MERPRQLSRIGEDRKERLWEVEIGEGCYRVLYGLAGGALSQKPWKHVGGKTTKARKEALRVAVEKLYAAKLAEGYTETAAEKPLKMMLPRPWVPMDDLEREELSLVDPNATPTFDSRYPVAIQPRMAGVTGLLTKEGVRNRGGKLLASSDRFGRIFDTIRIPDLLALEGVVYNHKYRDNAAGLNGLIARPGTKKKELIFYVTDAIFFDDEIPFKIRYRMLFDPQVGIVSQLSMKYPEVQAAPTYVVRNPQEDEAAFNMCVNAGYAGMMYRSLLAWYTPGLSKHLRERTPE